MLLSIFILITILLVNGLKMLKYGVVILAKPNKYPEFANVKLNINPDGGVKVYVLLLVL